jgi:hypothetical protein
MVLRFCERSGGQRIAVDVTTRSSFCNARIEHWRQASAERLDILDPSPAAPGFP